MGRSYRSIYDERIRMEKLTAPLGARPPRPYTHKPQPPPVLRKDRGQVAIPLLGGRVYKHNESWWV